MNLKDEELEAVIDLIDAAFDTDKLGKMGRKTSNILRSTQFKLMLEFKIRKFEKGMKQNDQNIKSGIAQAGT